MSDDFSTFLETMQKISAVTAGIESRREEIVQDLIAAKAKRLPSKFFHYTSFQGISGMLQSNNLWATDFRFLNDATELIYGARILLEELRNYGNKSGGDVSKFLERIANFYQEHGDTYRQFFETYIISLSEAPDMLSQWRAYADNAHGHCVEFSFDDASLFTIIGSNTPWAMEISPVIYEEKIQRQLIQLGVKKVLAYLNSTEWTVSRVVNAGSEVEQGIMLGFLVHTFEPFVTSFKHPGFSEEREWRVVASCASNLTDSHKKKNIRGGSYLECIFIQGDEINLWQRKCLPITSIVHGPLTEGKAISDLERAIEEEGYKELISCKRSVIPLK